MGGPFTCAVSARIVHDGRHFYGNIEKNRSMIMKADTRMSRGLGDLLKARVLRRRIGTPVAAAKVKPDTWKAHLECRAHLSNFQAGS